jgi:hypothetical protein
MSKNMKTLLFVSLLAALVFFAVGCPVAEDDTELPWTYAPGITDKTDFPNSQVKVVLSVTGDQDPRLALNYRMGNATGPYYFDYIVLSSAKMKKVTGGDTFTFTLDLSDVEPILNDRVALLSPLQSKGFKILLGVTNGGDGFTFANLPYALRQPFAKTIKDTLDKYGLDGIEFNDENGGPGAYPVIGEEFYDPENDETVNPDTMGDTVAVNSDAEVNSYWHTGGFNYSAFLTYFRLNVQSYETPTTSVIGDWKNNPILVRETGFAGGTTNSAGEIENYMEDMIKDTHRPEMEFTSITNQVNYFLSPNENPFGDTAAMPFGWGGSGQSIMPFAVHNLYSPGIVDLPSVTDDQLSYFSERFANGNTAKKDDDLDWGAIYGLMYYTNLSAADAAKLSICSRWVYGSREENERQELIGVHNDGPEVIFAGH